MFVLESAPAVIYQRFQSVRFSEIRSRAPSWKIMCLDQRKSNTGKILNEGQVSVAKLQPICYELSDLRYYRTNTLQN